MARGHVSVVATLAGVAAIVGMPSAPHEARHRSRAHLGQLEDVPASARGPISAALGALDRAYAIREFRAVNRAQRLRASFGPDGLRIASANGRFGLSLTGFGRRGRLITARPTSPQVRGNRVTYSRGPLSEWYANGPFGLEQGLDLARPPADGSGPLTLSLALSGNVSARSQGGAVVLSHERVRLRYGGLIATDARGRQLRSRLLLAGDRILVCVDDRRARYPVRVDPLIQQAELTATDGAPTDGFGNAVAVDGDTLVVGAVGHNEGRGAAYVFVKPASGWANATPPAELTASDATPGEQFGASVAISGDTIVIGDPNHPVGSNDGQGMAYVFVKPPTGWVNASETAKLTSNDDTLRGGLGISVAISGDTIVAGAWEHKVGSNDLQGAAYVFERPPTGWADATQNALTIADGAANDLFGYAVAVSGDTIVVGAPGRQVGQSAREGAAYLFVRSDTGWADSRVTKLTPTDGATDDAFGARVAVSGDTVVVGGPYHQVGLSRQGAAYVFVKPFLGWFDSGQTAELTASDGVTDDTFTGSVAISGTTILVGAPLHQVRANQAQGVVYLFAKPSSGWANATQTAEVTNADGAAGDLLGDAVDGSGTTVFAGAPLRAIAGDAKRGAVYVFAGVPAIAVDAPADNATYTLGSRVIASYSCTAAPGETITSCAGTVASGAPINTSRLGAHTFTVAATDAAGEESTRSVTYTVIPDTPGTGQQSTAAPAISRFTQSHRTWREGGRLATISRRRRIPVGTTFSFTLDQRARVLLTFTSRTSGRIVGQRCVAQTRKNRQRPPCRRVVATADTLSVAGHAGVDRVSFQGRISRTRMLKPGPHAVTITAMNSAARRSKPRQLTFTVLK